jgi:hypothetical protein
MRPSYRMLLLVLCAATLLAAQDPTPQDNPAQTPNPAAAAARPPFALPAADPQPYEKVITKDAKTKAGVFTVHQVKDKYYYEIPKSELGKEFLWVTQISRTTLGIGYGGQALGNRVVYWERTGNRIHLREVSYEVVADPKAPIAGAVQASNTDTIIMTFPVAAFAKDGGPVVEVTRLFTTDVFELSARQRLNATMMDPTRSAIDRVSAYPTNIEAEATHTYTRMPIPVGLPGAPANPFLTAGMKPGSATVVLHHSMLKLPERPMTPRLFDERVGYFYVSQLDYSRDEQRAPRRRYIERWRLEKKDPGAALSEPVKPIVYYIDSATPTKYVEYMKRGVESWQKAFEAAGFKNAIVAKLAPTPAQDPDFSPEDARYSVIRWLPSTIENAVGPNVHDPRTGEILNADIQFYHNVMNLARSWYVVQAGPLDARAKTLPLPDDLMGRLVQFVCAHEVGHTLGFQHNMKASSMYPQEKVRDREWVRKMGHAPSIMDYARFNYVAQPEDNIDVADLVPGIGPYDVWAAKWGYTPIPNAKTPDAEKPTLDTWAREQEKTPWFRFSTAGAAGSDPGELTEAVGDADALKSTALGLKNLQRVAKMLIPAATTRPGEPYDDLAELYGRMLGQWTLEMNHVAAIVGGFNTQQKAVDQDGLVYTPVSKQHQADAVKFLNENAFATPTWAVDQQILRRIEPVGAISRINNAQRSVLNNLLSSARFARLNEQEELNGAAAYSPAEFLASVRKGVWKELDSQQVKIGAFRRNLQASYLDLANARLNGASFSLPAGLPIGLSAYFITSPDEKPLYRAELRSLSASIAAALAKTQDRSTRAHLEGAHDQIARILDPKFAPSSGIATAGIRIGLTDWDPFVTPPALLENCWPDYIIKP